MLIHMITTFQNSQLYSISDNKSTVPALFNWSELSCPFSAILAHCYYNTTTHPIAVSLYEGMVYRERAHSFEATRHGIVSHYNQ